MQMKNLALIEFSNELNYWHSKKKIIIIIIINNKNYLFKSSQNIAKKNLNDADSFDDCQPSLSKLENRQRCQKP